MSNLLLNLNNLTRNLLLYKEINHGKFMITSERLEQKATTLNL